MSAPVDVLAVLDRVIERSGHIVASDVVAVRAAVAELIQADREHDAAREAVTASMRRGAPKGALKAARERFDNAAARRRAALARCGGAK